ncbi:MAG: ubiA [Gammaproteobacteria bacterium]|jgi:4-hydroxybenzoate polyprenyltransferase|nr:ubiA [Gammaproteobacteria bacterium]
MKKLKPYIFLMRLDKPIGIFLLVWPTLWALWLAGAGKPPFQIVLIFILGVILMRSAGCVVNDIVDQRVDGYVARTHQRPLVIGSVSTQAAMILFLSLMLCAFSLVLLLNKLTLCLAFVGAILAIIYPFLKRFTHLPQVGLGFAFSWGVPMAFAAVTNSVPVFSWVIFFAAVIWSVIYDTLYAMVDREDDRKIGIKSTAILFGKSDKWITGLLQMIFLVLLSFIGFFYQLNKLYYLGIISAAILFIYQQALIRDRYPDNCFKAFLNNHWVGCVIYIGIVLGYVNCCR